MDETRLGLAEGLAESVGFFFGFFRLFEVHRSTGINGLGINEWIRFGSAMVPWFIVQGHSYSTGSNLWVCLKIGSKLSA
jgi:hypothetical protein